MVPDQPGQLGPRGLLALLDTAAMAGPQLAAALETWSATTWRLDDQQVRASLDRLAADGLVARTGSSYAITPAGREALAEWFATGPGPTTPPRDELTAKVLLSLAGGHGRALEVITRQRRSITGILQLHRRAQRARLRATSNGLTALSPVLVDDAVAARAEADLRWLDLCEARLIDHTHRRREDT